MSALTISALCLPVSAPQAGIKKQTLIYDVYAGGIHAVQATLNMDLSRPDRYDLMLTAQTRGLLGNLAPWSGTFETRGWVQESGNLQPELHKSTATWRDEVEVKEYNYNRSGAFDSLVITEHEKQPEIRDVEAALTDGSVDVLSATLMVMKNVAKGGKCVGTSEVFDGKRRFEMVYAPEKSVELTPSKYNIYGGAAEKCTVEVKPIAGRWHKKPRGWLSIQEQGRERGTMPTIWMGKISKNGPAVPVKIFIKTAYGALFMHLAKYETEDEILIAENRVE